MSDGKGEVTYTIRIKTKNLGTAIKFSDLADKDELVIIWSQEREVEKRRKENEN